ncbi:MAG TPA: polysaccharide pyruvyl transferase family protein [Bacteroidota bacterium]|nr:polysaccharide pyruvyl transferase family protein [Bacteroidota bacterium]
MGPFGFGNLGDAAIQDAVIQHIRKIAGDAQVYGISQNPADTQKRHGIPAFPLNRMPKVGADWESHPREFIFGWISRRLLQSRIGRLIERAVIRLPMEFFYLLRSFKNLLGFDLLVVSGGGQLDDYWGGPWSHPYTLAKWGTVARIVGARFVFMSVGAGPIDYSLSKRFIRYALSLARYRSYRDQKSRALIQSIGYPTEDPVYPDLAYSLLTEAAEPKGKNGGELVIGVGPMSYFHPDLWPEKDQSVYDGYLRKLATFVQRRIGEGCCILLFPGEVGSDRAAMDDLQRMLKENGVEPSRLMRPDVHTVPELMKALARTDIVVASRFHGVLLAHVAIKPVIALSYHMKIDALMEEMGHGKYCLNIKTFEPERFEQAFQTLRRSLPEEHACIERKTREYRDLLDRQYDIVFN